MAPTSWLLAMPGWPANHEFLRIFRRMGIIAGQWRLGHIIPVWSTTAFGGAGSPSPILYHKTFTWLSALFFTITGAPKLAVWLSLVLVLAILFAGVAKSARILLRRDDLLIESTTGAMAVFASYTTTDWQIRGAMAETAGMAGVAWIMAWCLTLIETGKFSMWIGPLMATLALTHSVIALYCGLPIALAIAAAWPGWRTRTWSWVRRAFASAALCAILVVPWLILALPFARLASPELLSRYTPRQTHLPFARLLHERIWHWRDAMNGVTVQIDPLLLCFGVACAALIALTKTRRASGAFLIALCAVTLSLQTRWALSFYDVVPGAALIQFPFRLLVFVTIALALCGAIVLNAIRARAGRWPTLALCAAGILAMSFGKPWLGHAPAEYYSSADIDAALHSEAAAPEPTEYAPFPPSTSLARFVQARTPGPLCMAMKLDDMTHERATARFAVDCETAGSATLPVGLAPGMGFAVAGHPVRAIRICPDPLAHLAAAPGSVVTVTFPTAWRAARAAFSRDDPALSCRGEGGKVAPATP